VRGDRLETKPFFERLAFAHLEDPVAFSEHDARPILADDLAGDAVRNRRRARRLRRFNDRLACRNRR